MNLIVRLAREHFGTGRDSQGLLSALPLDFLKIDGSLMQGLSGNPEMQERVRLIGDAARKRSIQTVAERIEDANTMAVVWQHVDGAASQPRRSRSGSIRWDRARTLYC